MNTKEIIKTAIQEIVNSTKQEKKCIKHEAKHEIKGNNIGIVFSLIPQKFYKYVYFDIVIGKLTNCNHYKSFCYLPVKDSKSIKIKENISRFSAKLMRETALHLQEMQETFIYDFAQFIEERIEAKKEDNQ